jgi:hypothetical protein
MRRPPNGRPHATHALPRTHLRAAVALLPLVDGAMLVTDEGAASESFNNPDAGPGRELDDVAVLATIRPLLSSAADLREDGGQSNRCTQQQRVRTAGKHPMAEPTRALLSYPRFAPTKLPRHRDPCVPAQ